MSNLIVQLDAPYNVYDFLLVFNSDINPQTLPLSEIDRCVNMSNLELRGHFRPEMIVWLETLLSTSYQRSLVTYALTVLLSDIWRLGKEI